MQSPDFMYQNKLNSSSWSVEFGETHQRIGSIFLVLHVLNK